MGITNPTPLTKDIAKIWVIDGVHYSLEELAERNKAKELALRLAPDYPNQSTLIALITNLRKAGYSDDFIEGQITYLVKCVETLKLSNCPQPQIRHMSALCNEAELEPKVG